MYLELNTNDVLTEENLLDKLKKALKTGIQKISRFGLRSGQFVVFRYKSKGYEEGTLPFYDESPFALILSTKTKSGNYNGLNFNYIPIDAKKNIINKLKRLYPEQWDKDKILPNVSYTSLKSELKDFDVNFLIKEYIPSRITRLTKVKNTQFEKTASIDLGSFIGINIRKLWSEYKKGKEINQIISEIKKEKRLGNK